MNYESGIKDDEHSTSPPTPPQAPACRTGRWGGWLQAGRGRTILIILLGLLLSLSWHQPAIAPTPSLSPPVRLGRIGGDEVGVPTTTLLAVGDIMLSRNVSAKIEKANDPSLPFANLQEILSSADITFGNLECPLDPGDNRIYEGLIFRCLTKDFEGVVSSGFDVLSTANNHAFDQGLDNIDFTIDYLKSRNILPIGTAVSNSMELDTKQFENIIERNGVKFGFLAYSYSARNDGGRSTHTQIATMNIEKLKAQIAKLKTETDVITVSMHAGTEYTRSPNQDQIDFAHAAIDAGADIVLGHHPHWIQTVEVYSPTIPLSPDSFSPSSPGARLPDGQEGRRPEGQERSNRKGIIFYSLGNFVFDQMWSQETREGLMVKFQITNNKLQSAQLIPIIIENYCCPRLAGKVEKSKILKKINLESDEIALE